MVFSLRPERYQPNDGDEIHRRKGLHSGRSAFSTGTVSEKKKLLGRDKVSLGPTSPKGLLANNLGAKLGQKIVLTLNGQVQGSGEGEPCTLLSIDSKWFPDVPTYK